MLWLLSVSEWVSLCTALYTAEKPHALNISTIGKENSFGEYGDAFDE